MLLGGAGGGGGGATGLPEQALVDAINVCASVYVCCVISEAVGCVVQSEVLCVRVLEELLVCCGSFVL